MAEIYLVTDEELLLGKNLLDTVAEAVRGGVGMVQLREKDSPTRLFIERAIALKKILGPMGVPLIINDRVDVALAADADGIHVGQSDMPPRIVRQLLPPGKIVGLSVESPQQVLDAEALDVDYIAASPVFSTPTKTDTRIEWGLEGLRWIRLHSRHRIVAIGGIKPENAAEIVRAGASSLAIVSGICSAEDPCEAARRYKQIAEEAEREI